MPGVYPGIDASFGKRRRLTLINNQTLSGVRFIQRPPTAWQDLPGGRTPIDVHYSLLDATHFTIVPGAYDATQPLTVEMALSTFRPLDIASQVKAAPSGGLYQITTISDIVTQPIAAATLLQPTAGACNIRNAS